MDETIIQFITALRNRDIRVSLAESADALKAIEKMGIKSRDHFRISLRSTLIKSKEDIQVFEQIFPLFFGAGQPPPFQNPAQSLTPEEAAMITQALQEFTRHLRKLLENLLNGQPMSHRELKQIALALNLEQINDPRYQKWVSHKLQQFLQFPDLRQAIEDLMQLLQEMGMDRQKVEQIQAAMLANEQSLRQQLQQFAGQQIAENLSQQKPHDPLHNLYHRPFHSLSEEEMRQLRKEVQRLAAILRTRLALRLKHAKSGQLDAKATLRANLKHGSVPFNIKHRSHILKPKIVVLCDISTSMRYCTELMLSLLYSIQGQIRKSHAFAYISDLEYISPYFEARQPAAALGEIMDQMPAGHYNTDLGNSLSTFQHNYVDTVDTRTTLIVVGDARNNYHDPNLETFRGIARRSRRAIWLNPEPPALWGSGDSDMLKYLPHCTQVFQASNLSQLAAAIDQLLLQT